MRVGRGIGTGRLVALTRDGRRGWDRVTGIAVNEHCKLARDEFDSLKTTLYDRTRHGPGGQNRASVPDFQRHLDGRVV